MKVISSRFIAGPLAAAALATMCGCSSLELVFKPSDQARHASFAHSQALFGANPYVAMHQTFIVLSGDWETETPYLDVKYREHLADGLRRAGVSNLR